MNIFFQTKNKELYFQFMDYPGFSALLLKDYDPSQRPMPWKGIKDPYLIWLSEIILQQTRVEQGWDYYLKFKKHYPTLKDLAEANDDDVMKLWEGLGYYSRARNLLAAARFVQNDLKGKFPGNYKDLLQLKGVGPYTAAAIASFAFNEKKAVLDGNVYRVLSRFFEISIPIDSTKGKKHFTALADKLIDGDQPALYNQAIMDLGAQICLPQNPLCDSCPLQLECKAYQKQSIKQYPVKEKSIKKRIRYFNFFLLKDSENQTFIQKRAGKDIWKGLYQLPLYETDHLLKLTEIPKEKNKISAIHNFEIQSTTILGSKKHILTHQTIHAVLFELKIDKLTSLDGYKIISIDKLNKFAFPRLINLLLSG